MAESTALTDTKLLREKTFYVSFATTKKKKKKGATSGFLRSRAKKFAFGPTRDRRTPAVRPGYPLASPADACGRSSPTGKIHGQPETRAWVPSLHCHPSRWPLPRTVRPQAAAHWQSDGGPCKGGHLTCHRDGHNTTGSEPDLRPGGRPGAPSLPGQAAPGRGRAQTSTVERGV